METFEVEQNAIKPKLSQMKAAILCQLNAPLEIVSLTLPSELKFGQVLVKVSVAGICGAQLQEIAGYKNNERFIPHLMGHEGAGKVVQIGPGVTKCSPGDRVVLHWRKGSGIDSDFPVFGWNGKKVSGGKVTTFSEYSIVSESRLTVIKENLSDSIMALLGCSLTTALGVVERDSQIKFGSRVLISGCGGVGLSAIMASRARGAGLIHAFDAIKEKKDLSLRMGAHKFSDQIPQDHLFDVIIDTTGSVKVIERLIRNLDKIGQLILVGQPIPGTKIVISNALELFSGEGKTITFSQGGSTNPDLDIPRYATLFSNCVSTLDHLVTKKVPLREINLGINSLREGNMGRVLIDMNS